MLSCILMNSTRQFEHVCRYIFRPEQKLFLKLLLTHTQRTRHSRHIKRGFCIVLLSVGLHRCVSLIDRADDKLNVIEVNNLLEKHPIIHNQYTHIHQCKSV